MSETLRLELETLGVKVITVVAGIIRSNSFSSLKDNFGLPSESYYASLEGHIGGVAKGVIAGMSVMTAEGFGKEVVKGVLAGKTGCTYTGTLGWAAAWVLIFPTRFLMSRFKSALNVRD